MPSTLTVSFTPVSPAPANGYRVSYRPAGSTAAYTQVVVASSPAVLSGLTANAYEGKVEAICGTGIFSDSAQTFSAVTPMACGSTRTETYTGTMGYVFPLIPLNLALAVNGTQITINYNALTRPNKFTVRNLTDNSVEYTTGWVGTASYSGPWGASLSVSASGNFNFVYNSVKTYALEIECGPANLANYQDDTISVSLSCASVVTTTTVITTSTTSSSTTAAGPAVTYYRLTFCIPGSSSGATSGTYWTNTALTEFGQRVQSPGNYYYIYQGSQTFTSPPANFIGYVIPMGTTGCPIAFNN